MKFGVCAIIKNENLYLREWVEHYINLGFDKIILYDNNNTNGEVPNVVIQDYIDNGIVDMYNYRGKSGLLLNQKFHGAIQKEVYNECLHNYRKLDWIAFLDIDEFLYLEKYKKIQYLFEDMPIYNQYDCILISWMMYSGDGKIYYENKKVQERFKSPKTYNIIERYTGYEMNHKIKSFVSTKNENCKFGYTCHRIDPGTYCNVYGQKCYDLEKGIDTLNGSNHHIMYIKHYYTKSLVEFLERTKNSLYALDTRIDTYKQLNEWTDEHEKVYQKFLKDNNIKQ